MSIERSRVRRGNRAGSLRFGPGGRSGKQTGKAVVRAAKPLQFEWAEGISDVEWAIYQRAIHLLREANIPFMLGGGFALAAFTGRWRDTKDIDFYISPKSRRPAIAALNQAGFEDYYSRLAYDRNWIYRSVRADVIVDMIWSMANQRAQVDPLWFERAGRIKLRGEELLVIPPEEFMWCKLYILQRDHCDWTDIFNLLCSQGPAIDWEHLRKRLEDDVPLLRALLTVYAWLCPPCAAELPAALWAGLEMAAPSVRRAPIKGDRVRLLDSRKWFVGLLPPGGKLEV